MYANYLVDLGKLVYLVSSPSDAMSFKKVFDSPDSKAKIFFKCVEEMPPGTYRKVKPALGKNGVIRADWLGKVIDRAPEMIIMIFNVTSELSPNEKWQDRLVVILKRINKVYEVLKSTGKDEQVLLKIIIITARTYQNSNLPPPEMSVEERIVSFLKFYESSLFVIVQDFFNKDILKYRGLWLQQLDKNYERKYRKLQKKMQESFGERRIGLQLKMAYLSQIMPKIDSKQRYADLYANIKFSYKQIQRKEVNIMMKYIEIRELRIVSDVVILRYIKFKLGDYREVHMRIMEHLDYFKMRSIDPRTTHTFFYYEELQWRANFLDNLLEVLYSSDMIEAISRAALSELVAGLLTYLHKLAKVNPSIMSTLPGKVILEKDSPYFGRLFFQEPISENDIVMTSLSKLVQHRRDYSTRGVQVITRYKTANIFGTNVTHFLNIYLIRFYLVDGKFLAFVSFFYEILKVQLHRANFFTLNELFEEVRGELPQIDTAYRVKFYAVASLICDYFQHESELEKYLKLFLDSFQQVSLQLMPQINTQTQLISCELTGRSNILRVQLQIPLNIANIERQLNLKIMLTINHQFVSLRAAYTLIVEFNQPDTIFKIPLQGVVMQTQLQSFQHELKINPLDFVAKDCILKVERIKLKSNDGRLQWILNRDQIVFKKYDSVLIDSGMPPPQIVLKNSRKTYYLNEIASLEIDFKSAIGCRISGKFLVSEDDDKESHTNFFASNEEGLDMTNSKLYLVLANDRPNNYEIRPNRLGLKKLRLSFNFVVERTVTTAEGNERILKQNHSVVKEIQFSVQNLFTVTQEFKQVGSGRELVGNKIPINKLVMLSFEIKANLNIYILEIGQHCRSDRIKYHKTIREGKMCVNTQQQLTYSLIFEVGDDCRNDLELFLATLFIKWTLIDALIPKQNLFLSEDIKINPEIDKARITLQHPGQVDKKKKFLLSVTVTNLTHVSIRAEAHMDSTQVLLRIGEKTKISIVEGNRSFQFTFQLIAMQSGVFQLPQVQVLLDGIDSKQVTNYLIYCI